MAKTSRANVRKAVHGRIRRKVRGTAERPRLAVYRSTNHIYAQVIDDDKGVTLVSASSLDKDLKNGDGGNIGGAQKVGKAIAERAIKEGIDQVVFDRGGYVYHGRVKALIEATREAGLNKTSSDSESAGAKGGDAEKSENADGGSSAEASKETKKPKGEAAEETKAESAEANQENAEDESADSK